MDFGIPPRSVFCCPQIKLDTSYVVSDTLQPDNHEVSNVKLNSYSSRNP